jgi:excisionase family DNA binding protein
MENILHGRADAARLLAISLRKLDRLVQEKHIRTIKIGKRTLIPHVELEKFARHGTGSTQDQKIARSGDATKRASRDSEVARG